MPDDNGVSGAQNLAKGAGKSVGKAGKTAGKAGKKITDNISEQISKLFKGKKKWLAAILAVVLFGICVLLIMAIVLLMLTSAYTANEGNKQNASAGSSLQQKGTFYPRLEEPVKGKESVNHTGKKVDDYYFNSTNPLEAAGYGMPNCTAYAWSRAYEILDSVPNLCTGNAQEWYGYNKTYDYYPYGATPRLGAIAVWSHGDSGHVAVVEKIEGDTVTFSNSAWQGTFFFLLEVDPADHPNYWTDDSWNLLGFIYIFDELVSGTGTRMSEMPLYIQYEEPWGSHTYGDNVIADSGCGPTSIAMVASYLTGNSITPNQVADYLSSSENGGRWGHYSPGVGMTHDVWDLCADHYGFKYVKKASGIDEAYEALQNDQVVINSQGSGIFTSGGHFIVLSGLWSDGKIKVNDPNDSSYKNYKDRHFSKSEISAGGVCYYVFDSYNLPSSNSTYIPESEKEFVEMFNTYFSKLGYSKAAICGILGNIYAECSMDSSTYFQDWIPDAGGAPGNSNGICQWYGDNCDRFRRDCPNWNKSVTAQFEYLAGTLDNDGQGSYNTKYYYYCTGCKAAIQSVSNTRSGAIQAAVYFRDYYERPNMGFDQSIRETKAAEYWNMI